MKGISGYIGLIRLIALLVLLPLLVWSWGIRPTAGLYRTVRAQALRIASAPPAEAAAPLPGAESSPESKENGVKSGMVLHRLAPTLDLYGVTAERYTPYCLHSEAGAELYAGELLLSGGFIPMTRLLAEIEKHPRPERIVSVRYASAIHPQSRKKQIQMTVVFQQAAQNEQP